MQLGQRPLLKAGLKPISEPLTQQAWPFGSGAGCSDNKCLFSRVRGTGRHRVSLLPGLYVSLAHSMANLEPEKLNTGLTPNLELKVNCHYVICFRIVNLGRTELLQIESKEIIFFSLLVWFKYEPIWNDWTSLCQQYITHCIPFLTILFLSTIKRISEN